GGDVAGTKIELPLRRFRREHEADAAGVEEGKARRLEPAKERQAERVAVEGDDGVEVAAGGKADLVEHAERHKRRRVQMAKLVPQPQDAVASGLWTSRPSPMRLSTRSISEPSM